MPSISVRSRPGLKTPELTKDDLGEPGIELLHVPCDWGPIIVRLPGKHILVGYLVQDEDCGNPLKTCDGMGEIRDDYEFVRDALLCNDLGYPDFERFLDSANEELRFRLTASELIISDEEAQRRVDALKDKDEQLEKIAMEIREKSFDPFLVPLREWDGSHWNIEDEETRVNGVWDGRNCREHVEYTAMLGQLPEGTDVSYKSIHNPDGTCITRPCRPGEKSYFKNLDGSPRNEVPDERFHNVITYTTPSGREQGGFKSFKAAIEAAAEAMGLAFDPKKHAVLVRQEARKRCKEALEEYQKWADGDCYGRCVEIYDPNGRMIKNEACWGFIGIEYAREELKEEVKQMKEHFKKTRKKPCTTPRM